MPKEKEYKVYGDEEKERYLFTTSARNKAVAKKQALYRVKGAYKITRVIP